MIAMTSDVHGKRPTGVDGLRWYSRFSEELGLYVNLTMRGGRVAGVELAGNPPEVREEGDNPYLSKIVEHLSTGREDLSGIPLDLRVTPFEGEVLEAMRAVPPGEVVTYGELARRLGRPGASRAVGNACARNPAIVVVPCHRVVPASGGLGNYSGHGGTATKAWLLEKEGALAKAEGRRQTAKP